MNPAKKYYLIRLVLTTLFGAVFGLFFFLMAPYASELFDVLVIAMGLLTAIFNLPGVFLALRHIRTRGEWINLLLSLGAVALGIALMLLQRSLLMVLLGIYSAVLPIVRILLVKYEPVTTEGGSTFEIPVTGLDVKISVVADTVAMSQPHEIEYTILLDSATLEELK